MRQEKQEYHIPALLNAQKVIRKNLVDSFGNIVKIDSFGKEIT